MEDACPRPDQELAGSLGHPHDLVAREHRAGDESIADRRSRDNASCEHRDTDHGCESLHAHYDECYRREVPTTPASMACLRGAGPGSDPRHARARGWSIVSGLEVVPATAERFDDVVAILGEGCLCQYWRMTSAEYSRAGLQDRLEALRAQLAETPPAGMLAYAEDVPAGWLGFGPRPRVGRLVRSRTIPAVDDLPVWAIYCFTVRVGYRRRGIARALLDGLIDYAREQGAPALEAYPVDTGGARIHGTAAYVGTIGMFERAGFRRVVETAARSDHKPRWLMRLELS
jgi:ribosomal protein S18 acetylase RimI-like enzyme